MKKKLVLLLCVISCLMLVTGCSLTKENKNLNETKLSKNAEDFVSQWFSYDFQSTIDQYKDQMTSDQIKSYKDYIKMQKKHGAMKKIVKTQYSTASDSATVVKTVKTEKAGELDITVTYDENGEISDWKAEEHQTVGQIMGKAALNTVMSMAIVFCVLIFISLLISCFKFISKAQAKADTKTEPAAVETKAAPVVEENLTDDLELVAVITAAIAAASESECTDGLVVRSIVRRS